MHVQCTSIYVLYLHVSSKRDNYVGIYTERKKKRNISKLLYFFSFRF